MNRQVFSSKLENSGPWLRVGMAVFICSLVGLSGCATTSGLQVKTLYQSQQCGIKTPALRAIDSLEKLYSFSESQKRLSLDGKALEIPPPPADGRAILLAWGEQPTAGYQLLLKEAEAIPEAGVLTLPVEFIKPAPGLAAAQVVTSPCMLLSVSSRLGYSSVAAGKLQLALDIP